MLGTKWLDKQSSTQDVGDLRSRFIVYLKMLPMDFEIFEMGEGTKERDERAPPDRRHDDG